MSQEDIGKKDSTLIEYERIIRDLMNENETLKNKVAELIQENRTLKGSHDTIIETPSPVIQYQTKAPKMQESVMASHVSFSQDTVSLDMGKGPIVEGSSRRECPICGNTNKALIHENIDKTHMISAYPRMYGKKYKCGECGREWRLPVEF